MSKKKIQKKNSGVSEKISGKKVAYVLLTIALGSSLALLVFEIFSIIFVIFLEQNGLPVISEKIFGLVESPLSAQLFWTLLGAGAVGGFFLGLTWWQIVYIEKRHWKMKK